MTARTKVGGCLAAVTVLALVACNRLSMDVSTSGPESRSVEDAKSAGKQIKRFKDAYSAWQDAVESITADDENAVGDAASLELVKRAGGLDNDDTAAIEYVNSVANLVGVQGARDPNAADDKPRIAARRFYVGILRDEGLNAYSTPGGHIFITSGLLHRLNSECELAFVLGHEIAHIDAEDGLLALKAKTGTPAAIGSLTKDVYGQVNDLFDNKQIFDGAADKLVDIGMAKFQFFSREQEARADVRGLGYAVKAGYDPRGALEVLELLDEAHAEQPAADDHTHDPPAKRKAALSTLVTGEGLSGYERWQQLMILAGGS